MDIQVFRRYLTSRHFGRVVATVSFSADSGGVVQLSRQAVGNNPLRFTFPTKVLQLFDNPSTDWRELVIRLAVFQAHKCIAELGHCSESQPLNLGGPLWLGDLLLARGGTDDVRLKVESNLNNHRCSPG